ncbi:CBS domain-containing protein [bacterium 210820-DFI.6.52]|nr:CBS domain-containing protein [bacterium 210820-DFI.6.52]
MDVVGVELGDSIESIRDLFFAERYSRLPVYEKNIDNIVGILNQQEFIMRLVKGQRFQVADILQRALYVPPTKKISVLLGELQREKLHMAVVTDQYGGTLGIVTIEDLLEELVGDIWDEHEEITYAVIPLGEHTYEVDGDLNVYDMLDKLGFDSSRFDFESGSVSGWVLERLEHIPAQGEQFSFENLDVTVTQLDEQRINKITVHVNPLPEGEEE